MAERNDSRVVNNLSSHHFIIVFLVNGVLGTTSTIAMLLWCVLYFLRPLKIIKTAKWRVKGSCTSHASMPGHQRACFPPKKPEFSTSFSAYSLGVKICLLTPWDTGYLHSTHLPHPELAILITAEASFVWKHASSLLLLASAFNTHFTNQPLWPGLHSYIRQGTTDKPRLGSQNTAAQLTFWLHAGLCSKMYFNLHCNPADSSFAIDTTAPIQFPDRTLPRSSDLSDSTANPGSKADRIRPLQNVRTVPQLENPAFTALQPTAYSSIEELSNGLSLHSECVAPTVIEQSEDDAELRCWEHGCNGRRFSTRGNLVRHQRERADREANHYAKAFCPSCGAFFSRTTARNKHIVNQSCGRIRRYSNGRTRPFVGRHAVTS